jgi:hypothetical protein
MDQGMQTVGRTRTDCIMTAHEYLKTNDPNNHVHLRIETDRYYDSLDEGSKPKNDLKQRWDKLSRWYESQLNEWEKQYRLADSMDKHDLGEQKKMLRFIYEKERVVQMELNYHYYKTYWDGSNTEYPLE